MVCVLFLQPTTESNRLCNDPCSKTKNGKQTQMPAHTSRKSEAKEESKNLGPQTHKTTEVLPKPQGEIPASQNKPTGQSAMEDGSLLSMVSSYAVDVTVAASEKVCFTLYLPVCSFVCLFVCFTFLYS